MVFSRPPSATVTTIPRACCTTLTLPSAATDDHRVWFLRVHRLLAKVSYGVAGGAVYAVAGAAHACTGVVGTPKLARVAKAAAVLSALAEKTCWPSVGATVSPSAQISSASRFHAVGRTLSILTAVAGRFSPQREDTPQTAPGVPQCDAPWDGLRWQ